MLSLSTNISEKSYIKLSVVTSMFVDKENAQLFWTVLFPSLGRLESEKTPPLPQPVMTLLVLMHSFMIQNMKTQFEVNSRQKLFYLLSPLHSYQTLSLLIFSWSLRLLQVEGTVCRKTTGNFRTLHHSHLVSSEVFKLISLISLSDSMRK